MLIASRISMSDSAKVGGIQIMSRLTNLLIAGALLAIGVQLGVGCAEDDPMTGPEVNPTGQIAVESEPADLEAPWTLTGPDDFQRSATGSLILDDRTPGE